MRLKQAFRDAVVVDVIDTPRTRTYLWDRPPFRGEPFLRPGDVQGRAFERTEDGRMIGHSWADAFGDAITWPEPETAEAYGRRVAHQARERSRAKAKAYA